MTGTRGMGCIALLLVGAVASGAEPKASVVLAKLQAERIDSVAMEKVGPRQVVAFVHERLVAHAKREGYRLVWEVAEPLPEQPRVAFGVENGSLALLLEAAAGLADLEVRDSDEELVVRSLSITLAVRETRRFPIREGFWRPVRPRNPRKFFRQLGIDFPKGTEVRRSRDRRYLVVTHNPETLALVNEILHATFAYPYRWQLKLAFLDAEGRETPFAKPLVLNPRSTSSIRHSLGEEGSYVDISVKREHWFWDLYGAVRFSLGTRVVRGGRLRSRQQTTLVLGDGVDAVLHLGGDGLLRVTAEHDRLGAPPPPEHPRRLPGQWPWLESEEMGNLWAREIPDFEFGGQAVLPSLRKLVAASREAAPGSVGTGVVYLLWCDPGTQPEATGGGGRVFVESRSSAELRKVSLGRALMRLAEARGLAQMASANGVILHDPRAMPVPLRRAVYGPLLYDRYFIEEAELHSKTWTPNEDGLTSLESFHAACGARFPPGAHIRQAICQDGWVVVATNTDRGLGGVDSVTGCLDGGLFYSMLWHTEVRLVRLPADVVTGDRVRRLLASTDSGDRRKGAERLASLTEHTLFSAWTSGFDDKLCVGEFSGVVRGGGDVRLAVKAPVSCNNIVAQLTLDISGAKGRRSWHSTMISWRDDGPVRGEWTALRADSLDAERRPGEQSYLLVSHAMQPVLLDSRTWGNSQLTGREFPPSPASEREDEPPATLLKSRSADWDALFLAGLMEAGGNTTWVWPSAISSCLSEGREAIGPDGFPDESLMRFAVSHDRQCRLNLQHDGDGGGVAECLNRFGEQGNVPVPGGDGKSFRFTVTESVLGEKLALRWRIGKGWPRTLHVRAGETVELTSGLRVRLAVAENCATTEGEPPFAATLRAVAAAREMQVGWHRAALGRYGGKEIAQFRLQNAPLPVALARIGDRCRELFPDGPKAWRLRQPVFYGHLPAGAEKVFRQRTRSVGGMGGGMDDIGDGDGVETMAERLWVPELFWVDDGGEDMGGTAYYGGDDDDDDRKGERPGPAAYRLPMPKGRATVDLRNVTLAELLVVLEKAYETPLHLREKDGEVLVRAAPLAYTARFGVPKKKLKTKTQAEFRAWLVKRGVAFQGDDRVVYFRALDTVVARGREDFVRQVGKALGKGRERNANVEHRTLNIER